MLAQNVEFQISSSLIEKLAAQAGSAFSMPFSFESTAMKSLGLFFQDPCHPQDMRLNLVRLISPTNSPQWPGMGEAVLLVPTIP